VERCTLYLNAQAEVRSAQAAIERLSSVVQGGNLEESNALVAQLTEEFRRVENRASALSGELAGVAKVCVHPEPGQFWCLHAGTGAIGLAIQMETICSAEALLSSCIRRRALWAPISFCWRMAVAQCKHQFIEMGCIMRNYKYVKLPV
jgi:hypothetical protein